jgi:uncharacterized protein YecE (DUF72 family)
MLYKFGLLQLIKNIDQELLNYFFDSISEQEEKLLILSIQLPPSIQIVEGLESFRNIVPTSR